MSENQDQKGNTYSQLQLLQMKHSGIQLIPCAGLVDGNPYNSVQRNQRWPPQIERHALLAEQNTQNNKDINSPELIYSFNENAYQNSSNIF